MRRKRGFIEEFFDWLAGKGWFFDAFKDDSDRGRSSKGDEDDLSRF